MPKGEKGAKGAKTAPKPRVRMSPKAELDAYNGVKPEPKQDVIVPKQEEQVEPKQELMVLDKEEEQPQLELLQDAVVKPIERIFKVKVVVDQIGLKDKEGVLIDPNNNILKEITYESKGERVDIAQAGGRIANELAAYYENCRSTKGIQRSAGFNVSLHITDEVNGEKKWERLTIVEKLRMVNSIDVAFAVGNAILRQVEGDNAESLMTGNFRVSEDGRMFLGKMKFDLNRLALPLNEIRRMLDVKRKAIKKNVAENKKAIIEAI